MLRLDRLRLFMIEVWLEVEKWRCFSDTKFLSETAIVIKHDRRESRLIFYCYLCKNWMLETLAFLIEVKLHRGIWD